MEEAEEEGTLASPGMPANHERCRYDGFTFYSLPTGRFTATAPSTSASPLFSNFTWPDKGLAYQSYTTLLLDDTYLLIISYSLKF